MDFICCYKSVKIMETYKMETYKLEFMSGKVIRHEYINAAQIDDALNDFRRGKYGNHKVIGISKC